MKSTYRNVAGWVLASMLAAGSAMAQTSSLEGDVKGDDGAPLKGALVRIDRTDIKGKYEVKTDKKGHYFHAGLPLGTYNLTLLVDGKERDTVNKVRTRLGDPLPINFDLSVQARKQAAMAKAAETGKITEEQSREMSKEQKEAMEKQLKERSAAMAKNKALNDAFNEGMEGLKSQNFEVAVAAFKKASEMDGKQFVVWANMADAYVGLAKKKTGDEKKAAYDGAIENFNKALELKPEDAATHNNFGLALANAGKFPEAQAELGKAATLDPPNAGKYYFNLGALLINSGQYAPAEEAFKKATDLQPDYADAYYQYAMCLTAKATATPDGKIVAPPAMIDALNKYLQLRPDGVNAQAAKDMITSMSGAVETQYKNPSAPAPKKGAPKKK